MKYLTLSVVSETDLDTGTNVLEVPTFSALTSAPENVTGEHQYLCDQDYQNELYHSQFSLMESLIRAHLISFCSQFHIQLFPFDAMLLDSHKAHTQPAHDLVALWAP